ncbi:hypothetical protein [Phascolarctobacterium sp.]|uniref:hypothetical protein n=1 Tax=Phascolarctobacterium sp. TaxID=2049039 RepID=UPI003866B8A2
MKKALNMALGLLLCGVTCTGLAAEPTMSEAIPINQQNTSEATTSTMDIVDARNGEARPVAETVVSNKPTKATAPKATPKVTVEPAKNNGKEVSSIDALDMGVADTGETHFTKTDKKVTECTLPYTVAVLPYVDTSGLEGRSREMAIGAIKDALKKKYPGKNTSVTKIASNNAVQAALLANPMENAETPTLSELVAIGEDCGADRVIFVSILPAREKETGFMVIAGSQTYSATVMMKLKCVDVNEEKYLFNQNVEGIGSSTSINFWKIGEPSRAKAVKRGVNECMEFFLTSFE